MHRKVVAVWVSLVFILSSIVILVDITDNVKAPTTWYVDDQPGGTPAENFTSIQDAINAASDGDTIFVYNGTYFENVIVNKTVNLTGESVEDTKINGGYSGSVVEIDANWVNITGFMVSASGLTHPSSGIAMLEVLNCSISNINSTDNYYGIFLWKAHYNNIKNNRFFMNRGDGIHLFISSNNTVKENQVFTNAGRGIMIWSSDENMVENNNASDNEEGIGLNGADNNILSNNTASINNGTGIYLYLSINNILRNNTVDMNKQYGVVLSVSSYNYLYENSITGGGLTLWGDRVLYYNTHTITPDNLVNGKPLYYYKNESGIDIDGIPTGQVILANCSGSIVRNLDFGPNDGGILLAFSIFSEVLRNIIPDCDVGIRLQSSTNTTISDNELSGNEMAFEIRYSANNTISNNTITLGIAQSMLIHNSNNNEIIYNNITNSASGVYLLNSPNSTIMRNDIVSGSWTGVYIITSPHSLIAENNVSYKEWGIVVSMSSNVLVYHNNLRNNTVQALDNDAYYWNHSYLIGGNYWSNYTGVDNFQGPNQDIPGSDGIGDTEYEIDSDSFDHYPLMFPVESSPRTIDSLKITDEFGVEITTLSLAVLEQRQLFAYGINSSTGIKMGLVESDWSASSGGTIDISSGLSTNFTAGTVQDSVTVTAVSGSLMDTLIIDILTPTVDYINITDSPDGMDLTYEKISPIGSIQIYASGYNITSSLFVGLVNVTWNVNPPGLGTLSIINGNNTIFIGNDSGIGVVNITAEFTPEIIDNFTVELFTFTLDYVLITDSPDGSELEDILLNVGEDITLYASGYNSSGYLGLIDVNWSQSPDIIGTFDPDDGNSTIFSAGNQGGLTTVICDHPTLPISDNLSLSINAPTLDYIQIRNASSDQGIEVISDTFVLDGNGTKTYYCAGYNETAGYLGDVSAFWALDTSIGTLSLDVGAFTTFTATTEGTGILSANVSGIKDSISITVEPEIDDIPPEAPAGLNIVYGTEIGTLILSWNANNEPDMAGYNIYRSNSESSDFTKINSELITDTAFNDPFLGPGTTYYYYITAVDSADVPNESNATITVSKTTRSFPGSPNGLLTTSGDSYVYLSWNAPSSDGDSPIINYSIYRGLTAGSLLLLMKIGNVLSFNDSDVTNGVTYFYEIRATNAVGEGQSSGEVNAIPGGVPSVPSGVNTETGNMFVLLSWNAPVSDGGYPIINYLIYRSEEPGNEIYYAQVGKITTFNDTSVENGNTYYYRIRAVNEIGLGPLSEEVNATPFSEIVPSNTPPTCSITTPLYGAIIKDMIPITGTAADSDGSVQKVELRFNDGNWFLVNGTTSWTFTFNTNLLFDGEYVLSARSFDGTNYSSEAKIVIQVENEEEEKPDGTTWHWIFLILFIVGLIFLILYMRKRKGDKEKAVDNGNLDSEVKGEPEENVVTDPEE
jgi:parallel beta-helix repeat protein